MALRELKTLGSDAAALMKQGLGDMPNDKEVAALLRIATLAAMLTWIVDEVVRAVRMTWRAEYPYAHEGNVVHSAVADLLAIARRNAGVTEQQYGAISTSNRALFESIVHHMAYVGACETSESLAEIRRKALTHMKAHGSFRWADELLLRDAISILRHDGGVSETYALEVTNRTLVGKVPFHAAAVILDLRDRKANGESIDPRTAEQIIEAAKALADDADRDRFERSVEAKGAEDWALEGLRWKADLFALIVDRMIRECGLDEDRYAHDPGEEGSDVLITADNVDYHLAAQSADRELAESDDPWAGSKDLLRAQSQPADFGTVPVAPAEVVEGETYEITVGKTPTVWKPGRTIGRNWYTLGGSFLAYPSAISAIRVPASTLSAEIGAALDAYRDLVVTEDERVADGKARELIASSARRLIKVPNSRTVRQLHDAMLAGYRRFQVHVELPEDVERRARGARPR